MPTDIFANCWEEPPITQTPLERIYVCCGFPIPPASLRGTYQLQPEFMDPSDVGPCLELYGPDPIDFVLPKQACNQAYYAYYFSDGVPFYIGTTGLCCTRPTQANNGHVGAYGIGPGPVEYDPGNYCQMDANTGVVTMSLCANKVGSNCLFRVCIIHP